MMKMALSASAHVSENTKIVLGEETCSVEFDGWPATLNLFVQLGTGHNGVDAARWMIAKLNEAIEKFETGK
jgi:hypothetical protein